MSDSYAQLKTEHLSCSITYVDSVAQLDRASALSRSFNAGLQSLAERYDSGNLSSSLSLGSTKPRVEGSSPSRVANNDWSIM